MSPHDRGTVDALSAGALSARVRVTCPEATLGALRRVHRLLQVVKVPKRSVIRATDLGLEPSDTVEAIAHGPTTVATLGEWLEIHSDLPDDTAISGHKGFRVTLTGPAELVDCGDHADADEWNVIVWSARSCWAHTDTDVSAWAARDIRKALTGDMGQLTVAQMTEVLTELVNEGMPAEALGAGLLRSLGVA